MLFPVKEISPGERPVVKKWVNRAETVSLFMSLDVIVDLWNHCPEMSPAILSSFLFWTGAPQRYTDQSPLACGCLLPPLLVPPSLMFCHLHLCLMWARHMHTHRKTRKHRQHKYTCVNTHEEGTVTQTQAGITGVSVAKDICVQKYGRWCQ